METGHRFGRRIRLGRGGERWRESPSNRGSLPWRVSTGLWCLPLRVEGWVTGRGVGAVEGSAAVMESRGLPLRRAMGVTE